MLTKWNFSEYIRWRLGIISSGIRIELVDDTKARFQGNFCYVSSDGYSNLVIEFCAF